MTLVELPEEIVGYVELKNCSAILFGTNANSSKNTILKVLPRTDEPEVESATAREPLANSTEPLFHYLKHCCKNLGRYSNARCSLHIISRAVEALLARMATLA